MVHYMDVLRKYKFARHYHYFSIIVMIQVNDKNVSFFVRMLT